MAVFAGKQPYADRYRYFEEEFLREANKIILVDDGQPEVLETMHQDFVKILQNALSIKSEAWYAVRDNIMNKHGGKVMGKGRK